MYLRPNDQAIRVLNGPVQLVFHYFWNFWRNHKVFLNDAVGLSVNGWLYRGLIILLEISVVELLSNKIGYLCVRYITHA